MNDIDEIVSAAFLKVLGRDPFADPETSKPAVKGQLTRTQQNYLEHFMQGKAAKQIAYERGVTLNSVYQAKKVLRAMGALP